MPYADPEKQREAQARWYREKYQTDRKFRRAEASRKADWLRTEEGRTSNAAATARYRAQQLAAAKKAKTRAKAKPKAKPRAKVKAKSAAK